jgi:hypothetical protein
MSDAYKCDECGDFSTNQSGGSVSIDLSAFALIGRNISSGTHKKSDLCGECALEVYEKVFGEDE